MVERIDDGGGIPVIVSQKRGAVTELVLDFVEISVRIVGVGDLISQRILKAPG